MVSWPTARNSTAGHAHDRLCMLSREYRYPNFQLMFASLLIVYVLPCLMWNSGVCCKTFKWFPGPLRAIRRQDMPMIVCACWLENIGTQTSNSCSLRFLSCMYCLASCGIQAFAAKPLNGFLAHCAQFDGRTCP